MSFFSRKVPALISFRLPASRARSPKKKLESITPRCSSRSPTSSAVAPGGIFTITVPDPSPVNGWNSDNAKHASNATASTARMPPIHTIGRRRRRPGAGAGGGDAGGGGGGGGGTADGASPRPALTRPSAETRRVPIGRSSPPSKGSGGAGGIRRGGGSAGAGPGRGPPARSIPAGGGGAPRGPRP